MDLAQSPRYEHWPFHLADIAAGLDRLKENPNASVERLREFEGDVDAAVALYKSEAMSATYEALAEAIKRRDFAAVDVPPVAPTPDDREHDAAAESDPLYDGVTESGHSVTVPAFGVSSGDGTIIS